MSEQFNYGPAASQIGDASASSHGLMSATDKAKLDGIESQANKTTVSDSLSDTSTTNALSAAQGKALNDKIGTVPTGETVEGQIASLNNKMPTSEAFSEILIPSRSNLDNYRTPGTFIVPNDATAAQITNIPKGASGRLVVMYRTNASYVIQEYIPTTNHVMIYMRNYNAGSWSSWEELALKSDVIAKYLNTTINYGGASIFALMRNALGKNEYLFLVEEIGTGKYIFAHIHYDGSNLATKTTISNNGLEFGATNAGGTQVINGYSGTGGVGTFRWTAW